MRPDGDRAAPCRGRAHGARRCAAGRGPAHPCGPPAAATAAPRPQPGRERHATRRRTPGVPGDRPCRPAPRRRRSGRTAAGGDRRPRTGHRLDRGDHADPAGGRPQVGELRREVRRGGALPVLARLRGAAAQLTTRDRRRPGHHHGARLRTGGEPHPAAGGAGRRTGRTRSAGTHVRWRAARRIGRLGGAPDRTGRGGPVGAVPHHGQPATGSARGGDGMGCAVPAGGRSS